MDNCLLVAKFLEHVLKVAATSSIIEDICNNRFVSTRPALLSTPEYEYDDDGDDEAKIEEQTRGEKNIKPDRRCTRRGGIAYRVDTSTMCGQCVLVMHIMQLICLAMASRMYIYPSLQRTSA
jgi:hypothetical protein